MSGFRVQDWRLWPLTPIFLMFFFSIIDMLVKYIVKLEFSIQLKRQHETIQMVHFLLALKLNNENQINSLFYHQPREGSQPAINPFLCQKVWCAKCKKKVYSTARRIPRSWQLGNVEKMRIRDDRFVSHFQISLDQNG